MKRLVFFALSLVAACGLSVALTADENPPAPVLSDLEFHFHFTNTRSIPLQWQVRPRWSVAPNIRTSDGDWNLFVRVSSPGGWLQGFINHPEGLDSHSETFDVFEQMAAEISGTWTIDIDPGGEYHSRYFFEVDASGLTAEEFSHFGLYDPRSGARKVADSFSAAWMAPDGDTWDGVEYALYRLDPYALEAFGELDAEDRTVTPESFLKTGRKRLTIVYRNDEGGFPQVAVGTPHADLAAAPFDWHVGNHTSLAHSSRDFVIISGFDDWAARNFSVEERDDPAIAGLLASPRGDDLTNLEKYALGMAPFEFDPESLPALHIDWPEGPDDPAPATLIFRMAANDHALGFQVGVSSDLKSWDFSEDDVQIEMIDNSDGTATVTVRGPDVRENFRAFMRLLLTYGD